MFEENCSLLLSLLQDLDIVTVISFTFIIKRGETHLVLRAFSGSNRWDSEHMGICMTHHGLKKNVGKCTKIVTAFEIMSQSL